MPLKEPHRALVEALLAASAVTLAVWAASVLVPDRYVATAVGCIFLGVTWALVWRKDDARVVGAGLALGGLVLPGAIDWRRMARSAALALAWALALSAVTFVPFWFGWRMWWHPRGAFSLAVRPYDLANDVFGQLAIIALPEEAFYRGYLQSRLDDVWTPRWRIAGATVGPAIIVASAIFALGHLVTVPAPARLAVFFPSLVFGWLRKRTGGIGAPLAYHAACNVFSELLGRGYGVY